MKSCARVLVIFIALVTMMTVGCSTPSIYADSSIVCPLGKKPVGDTCKNYSTISDMQSFADAIFVSLGDFAIAQNVPPPVMGSMHYITSENAQSSPCAMSPNEPYVACYTSGELYIGSMMLYTNYTTSGPLAPITIIAHEYGHFLQNPNERDVSSNSAVPEENQADCVSGAYVAWLGTKQQIKLSSLIKLLGMIWDHGSNPYMEPFQIHGTPPERTSAFTTGYDDGLSACNAIGNVSSS